MRLPTLNNGANVRGYLADFERRFVRTGDGVVYLAGETGAGVKLPVEAAASLIAGMRATMVETDGRQPLSGQDAFFAAAVMMCVTIMVGALTGFYRTATALLMPIVVGTIILGPLLGLIRTELAWRRGLREAELRMEAYERLAPDATRRVVRPNPFRPLLVVVLTLCFAVIAGLFLATATSPSYVGAGIDRFMGWAVGFTCIAVIVLAFAYRTLDAFVRTPVPEAEIRLAVHDRRRRPLNTEPPRDPVRARPAAIKYGQKRQR